MRMRTDKGWGAAGDRHPGEGNLEKQIDDRRDRPARGLVTCVEARHIDVEAIK